MKFFKFFALSATLSLTAAKLEKRQDGAPATFWREAIAHNGRPGYLNSEDASLYSVWRDVRNTSFAGGVVGDGITDDSPAIQNAINFATGEVLYYRTGTAAQSSVPAIVYIPGGTYLIKNSLQVPVQTMIVGDPLNMPVLIADPSLGQNSIIYVYDSGNGLQPTTQFFHGLRNLIFDTTRVPANISGNGINLPGSQACAFQNLHFKMTVGSQHLGIQMYGPNDAGGSGLIIGDMTFHGGGTGIRLNNQQYNFKNMSFDSVATAINVHHVFSATLQQMEFKNCGIAVDMSSADVGGSVSLLDSTCSQSLGLRRNASSTVMKSRGSGSGDFTLVVENFKNKNCGASVTNADGKTLLSGSVKGVWVLGPTFGDTPSNSTNFNTTISLANTTISTGIFTNTTAVKNGTNSTVAGVFMDVKRPSVLTDKDGSYFTMQIPQYEEYDVSQFSDVKSDFGAIGDGKTDDTAAIQAALLANAGNKITFLPQGTYLIYQTIYVPPGSIMVGEVWSVLNAAGSHFSDASNPQVMLRVGHPGEVGVAQFTDLLFSVYGVLPGAILVEVSMAGEKPGDVGFWNTHYRIGGWIGSGDIRRKCQTDDTTKCKAAFLMLHLTQTSSVYLENIWGWTADHDIDGGPNMNIATGRGVLIEATAGTWLVGTGFEHNTLYQYQLVEAENVYMGLQQSETPYWQGPDSPNKAPDPWAPDARYNDPEFSDCGSNAQCNMAWMMRIVGGKRIFAYNSAFWVFFNHWAPGNYLVSIGQDQVGQEKCTAVESGTTDLYYFNINTRSCDYMVFDNNRTQTTQMNAPGSWGGAAGAYLA
ncbi:hypothetical protein PVAG01_00167 [Phlyctema vagabunda]|uniref:Rhamnogalacturonase A/B/Epimerase-like pectate lyase domain-containing protein n=1 Tax=Phlyctema vagabunda TaxID=108571 RepID=A0ABR4PTG4_9HELO